MTDGFVEVRDPTTGQIISRRSASITSSGQSRFSGRISQSAAFTPSLSSRMESVGHRGGGGGGPVEITVDSADADRRVEKLALFLSDLRPFWPIVKRLVTGAGGWLPRQFETEGAFGGTPWEELSPRYAAIKATVFPGKPILQAAGGIRRAASNPKITATARSLTLTIDDSAEKHGIREKTGPVLQYHQEGQGVPKRPLVFGDPLPPAAAAELELAGDGFVRDLLGRI